MLLRGSAAALLLMLLPAAADAGGLCGSADPDWVFASPGSVARVPGGSVLPHEVYQLCPEPDMLLPLTAAIPAGAGVDAVAPDRFDPNGDSMLVSLDRQVGIFRPADVLRCPVGVGSSGGGCTRVFDSLARGVPAHVNLVGLDQLGSAANPVLAVSFDQAFRVGAQVLMPQRIYTFAVNGSSGPGELSSGQLYGFDLATGMGDFSLNWNNRLAVVRDRVSRSSGGGVAGRGQMALQVSGSNAIDRVVDFGQLDASWRASGVRAVGSLRSSRASFVASPIIVFEDDGSINLEVVRPMDASGVASVRGTIRYSAIAIDGTAVAGVDYEAAPPQLVSFEDGESDSKFVSFTLIDNAVADGTRVFTVRLTPISAFAATGPIDEVAISIGDDEGGLGDAIFADGFE